MNAPADPRFLSFLNRVDGAIAAHVDEAALVDQIEPALRLLVAQDLWLPEAFARQDAARYQQYLLYLDPQARYSVQSFVWAPGQGTPIHNHTVWGLVGVLRGAEICREYSHDGVLKSGNTHRLTCGEVDRVSPTIGDWHAVSNAQADAVSMSIHIYGGDIGRIERQMWDEAAGALKPFVSGYSNGRPWVSAR